MISGVVDWSSGSWGPAAADHLLEAGERLDHDRYWDPVDVLDLVGEPGIGPRDERALDLFEEYVAGLL